MLEYLKNLFKKQIDILEKTPAQTPVRFQDLCDALTYCEDATELTHLITAYKFKLETHRPVETDVYHRVTWSLKREEHYQLLNGVLQSGIGCNAFLHNRAIYIDALRDMARELDRPDAGNISAPQPE